MRGRPPRDAARSRRLILFVAAALAFIVGPSPVQAQSAATLAPTDPVYADLARLEALGLVPRGTGGAGPWSVARIAWMLRDAEAVAAQRTFQGAHRDHRDHGDDVDALLARLGARFPADADAPVFGLAEVEGGGGRSPGRYTPDRGLGRADAVMNPLWMGRGGRSYGDRSTAAVAARLSLPLGDAVAVSAGVRRAWTTDTGEPLGSGRDPQVEHLSLRAQLGSLALDVGRNHAWTGDPSSRALALSANGPALDMIRLSTDFPLSLRVLGELDFSLFVADLGARQVPAHAKLFGVLATSRPAQGVEVGLALLNKQLGEGAPEASLTERLKDLTWIADWFAPGVTDFSDKLAQISVRVRSGAGTSVFGEALFTDFDRRRLRHSFKATAGYRVGAEAASLGTSGRHSLGVEASWLGPDLYLHHQYVSGHTAGGFPLGSYLGPDSRSVRVSWGYHPTARGWWGEVGLTADDARGDTWRPGDEDEDGPERLVDGPDEIRLRGDLAFHGALAGGRGGVDLTLGLERVRSFAFQASDDRLHGAALVRFWHAF